ncbi:hypothetical protein HELRODRAFT_128135, partial [Helobdella robusta]|uniref:WW domain-containing protein n=1 Tax=Helobdella robusta TaxID=6412 RepID=T1EHL2_HELRO
FKKPATFADCGDHELPFGWEKVRDVHGDVGVYYVNHHKKTTQIEDPRIQWKREQERMLREYLENA